jgi:hypothetical protein
MCHQYILPFLPFLNQISMKKITLILSFCLLGMCHFAISQTPVMLNIPSIFQKDNSWCWAACAEMALKYNSPGFTKSQCDIATYRFLSSPNRCLCSDTPCASVGGNCTCASTGTNCRNSLNSANFKSLLTGFSYASNSANYLDWAAVRGQIDGNKSFIIGINRSSSSITCKVTHYVLGKGYRVEGMNFINTNDPYACAGSNMIEIRLFSDKQPERKHCFFLYDIKSTKAKREIARSMIFTQDTLSEDCNLGLRKSFNNEVIYDLVNYEVVRVYYDDNLQETNVVDVISKKKCQGRHIVTRMQYMDGAWEPAFILRQIDPPTIALNKTYLLSNNISFQEGKTILPYDKIIFASHPYEFYRFQIMDKGKLQTYYTLAHVDVAIIDNQTFKKGQIFTQNDFSKFKFDLKEQNPILDKNRLLDQKSKK